MSVINKKGKLIHNFNLQASFIYILYFYEIFVKSHVSLQNIDLNVLFAFFLF